MPSPSDPIRGVVRILLLPLALPAISLAADPPAEFPPPPRLAQEPTETARTKPGWTGALHDALVGGRFWIDLNYRFGYIDQQGFEKDAYASTLRTALGYESAAWHGLKGTLEFENVSGIGNDLYNSTDNGVTNRPVEADPTGTSINQVYLSYVGVEKTDVRLGRQEVTLDNQRFVGPVGWRQKHETLDAVTARSATLGNWKLFYGYVDRVNTVTRSIARTNTHLLNVAYDFEDFGKLTAYGYWLDFQDNGALSSGTLGGRFVGERVLSDSLDLLYQAEFANQRDIEDNPNPRNANYYLLNLGVKVRPVTIKAAVEVLDGDGRLGGAFQTPLGTRHAFNGFADKFLVTPDTGLQDVYLHVGAPIGKTKLFARFHDFRSTTGSIAYGQELDLVATYPVTVSGTLGFKLASYWADGAFNPADGVTADTTKAWLWFHYRI